MMSEPIISIHIITYNSALTIRETIDSVLSQDTRHRYEIVISDDASMDLTPDILLEYKNKFPEIIDLQLNRENKGIVRNYFDTLERCKGKYYFDLAGDDFFNSNSAIEEMVNEMECSEDTLGFIEFEFDKWLEEENIVEKSINKNHRSLSKIEMQQRAFNGLILPAGWCMNTSLVRKFTDIEEYRRNNITVEDYPIAVELTQNCNFKHYPKSVMTYRIRNGSVSNCTFAAEQINFADGQLRMSRYFYKKYKLVESWWHSRESLYYLSRLNIAIRFKNYNQIKEFRNLLMESSVKLTPRIKLKVILTFYPKIYMLMVDLLNKKKKISSYLYN